MAQLSSAVGNKGITGGASTLQPEAQIGIFIKVMTPSGGKLGFKHLVLTTNKTLWQVKQMATLVQTDPTSFTCVPAPLKNTFLLPGRVLGQAVPVLTQLA